MQHRATKTEDTIRVLIADASKIHAQLLAGALRSDPRLQPVSAVSDCEEVLSEAIKYNPQILVINCGIDEQASRTFELMRELRSSSPATRIIILLESTRQDLIVQAFRAGARGLFSLRESVDLLPKCIRSVHEGQIWADSIQMSVAIEALQTGSTFRGLSPSDFKSLSERETQVVQAVAEGLTNHEIGERLGISQHTVKNHLFRIFDKLGVSNRMELLFMALSRPKSDETEPEYR